MEPSRVPEDDISIEDELDIENALNELDWVDEDTDMEPEDEEEEECEEESTDFSDDEYQEFCIECGDRAILTVRNAHYCDLCYEGVYRDYD
jgi:hypothetical protein